MTRRASSSSLTNIANGCRNLFSPQPDVGEKFEELKLGEPVEFNEEPGEEGPHAMIVKVAWLRSAQRTCVFSSFITYIEVL